MPTFLLALAIKASPLWIGPGHQSGVHGKKKDFNKLTASHSQVGQAVNIGRLLSSLAHPACYFPFMDVVAQDSTLFGHLDFYHATL